MSRSAKKQKTPMGGPFLAAAVFCDNIVHGADGALSVIRIVDKIIVTIPADAPPDVLSESSRILVQTWVLLMFKSGSAKGKHEVALMIHSPAGKKTPSLKQEFVLSPNPSGGANVRVQFGMAVKEGGLFLVDVLLDGKVVTRMPLQVDITREVAATITSPPAPKTAKSKRQRG